MLTLRCRLYTSWVFIKSTSMMISISDGGPVFTSIGPLASISGNPTVAVEQPNFSLKFLLTFRSTALGVNQWAVGFLSHLAHVRLPWTSIANEPITVGTNDDGRGLSYLQIFPYPSLLAVNSQTFDHLEPRGFIRLVVRGRDLSASKQSSWDRGYPSFLTFTWSGFLCVGCRWANSFFDFLHAFVGILWI